MEAVTVFRHTSVIALAVALASCSTWNSMDKSEKTGTAVGAAGGAVTGAVVGGPVGAVVGAGVGGYAGHEVGENPPGDIASGQRNNASSSRSSTTQYRNRQSTSNMNAGASQYGNRRTQSANNTEPMNASGAGNSTSRAIVRSAQQALNDQGFNAGRVDGVYGPHTRSAVREFQQTNGLTENGKLDHATLAKLGVAGRETTASSNEEPSQAANANVARDETQNEPGYNEADTESNGRQTSMESSNPPSRNNNNTSESGR